ncbi:Detected protein of unknown function [Hibiscus syriacus]|uniref:START domain-containing protein n=1 Tax=Hibiscus syriacus TaxID=106335 RepID=A0A6A3AV68_HIBSY|nr:Detected protein of unknown function [Hibiscus syriacus]
MQSDACESWAIDNGDQGKPLSVSPSEYESCSSRCSTSIVNEGRSSVVSEEDLKHLWQLVEMRDGGPTWIHMMGRSTPNMSYHAWRRDPNNATAKMVRDFFWDDEFRPKWDDMLAYSATIEERSTTGTMSARISGQNSFDDLNSRLEFQALRFHNVANLDVWTCTIQVDMGITWEIAKLGVRQGMWAMVKKIEPGLLAYQKERESLSSLSQSAYMAQINTKISAEYLRSFGKQCRSIEVCYRIHFRKPSGSEHFKGPNIRQSNCSSL